MGRLSPLDERDRHGFNDNWWCAGGRPPMVGETQVTRPSLEFVPPEESEHMSEIASRLEQLEAAPRLLGNWVIDYSNMRPDDPRVPEALHRVVWSTRWGCAWEADLGPLSKAAFDLLHRYYPDDPWTAKTPHWFD